MIDGAWTSFYRLSLCGSSIVNDITK